jgi:hypothetical protein
MRSIGTLTAALLVPLAAAGCTSSGPPASNATTHPADRSRPATPSSSQAPSAEALPPGVVGATHVPAKVANKPALRPDVSLASCSPRTHGWQASGTAHNPRSAARSYKITVFFTTDNATVIGVAATTVHVPGKASRSWTAGATFHAAKPTLCVLRGVG